MVSVYTSSSSWTVSVPSLNCLLGFCVLRSSWVDSVRTCFLQYSWGSLVLCMSLFFWSGFCTAFFFLGICGFYLLPSSSWVAFCTALYFLGINGFYVLPSYSWRSIFSEYFLLLLEWFLYCLLLRGDLWFLCTSFFFLGSTVSVYFILLLEWFSYCFFFLGIYGFYVLPSSLGIYGFYALPSSSWGSMVSTYCFLVLEDLCILVSVLPSSSWESMVSMHCLLGDLLLLCTSFFFLRVSALPPSSWGTGFLRIFGSVYFLLLLESFCIASFFLGELPSWGSLISIYCLVLLLFVECLGFYLLPSSS